MTPDQLALKIASLVIEWRDTLDPQRNGIQTWRALSAVRMSYPDMAEAEVVLLVSLIVKQPVEHVKALGRAPHQLTGE